MRNHLRMLGLIAIVALATLAGCTKPAKQDNPRPTAIPATAKDGELIGLLARPDATFTRERAERTEADGVAVQEMRLTSQTWQGIPWRHRLQVFRAASAPHPEFCLLVNTGGSGGPTETALGAALAKASGCTVAILYNVPNQPLFGDRREDALIAYTWQKFFETDDPAWILNVAMTRSVLRAMDAVQAAAKEDGTLVTGFAVTVASKRGWTAWLAGASGDRRVKAIAPAVFDMLNIPEQIPHQVASFGKPSEMIGDYTGAGLLNFLDTPQGRRLVGIVDPWAYRDRLTMPKLMLLGTNDRYWATDALNLYWDGLKGEKRVLYVPNAGHGLDRVRMGATLAAFARSVASGKPLPSLRWETATDAAGKKLLVVSTDAAPVAVRLYRAQAATRDFRDARWTPEPMEKAGIAGTAGAAVKANGVGNGHYALLPAPSSGYAAAFAEFEYRLDARPVYLSTQMTILPEQRP